MRQQLPLSLAYGKFLKERYGVKDLTLSGSNFAVSFKFQDIKGLWIGVERGQLQGKVKYKDLNGTSRKHDLELEQTILTFSYLLDKSWQLGGGIGNNKLSRKFYGYGDHSITVNNIAANSGIAESTSKGTLTYGQLTYHLLDLNQDRFQLSGSYRYTSSVHQIRASDQRPALNTQGEPVSTQFDLGGHAWLIHFGINF
ncbi:MAG: hypothetical protein COB67_13125 [SAR324 cluster bacterium]|uniref:Outer membrane protein beta-barrel domain-containing protein n=1 Tax=SAR324 cluster bacterium TaxID=2024889 RepID=A0A2A4SPZ4_9DELT|nr:MAG: hypothetical protein COB67_13125 [SAR324 cluster bacterium]